MATMFFSGESWPVFFTYKTGEGGSDIEYVKAPFDMLMLEGEMYVSTYGFEFNPGTSLNNAEWETEIKYRGVGPICISKMMTCGEHEWGYVEDTGIRGVHKLSFI